jgi:hypothetical protein
MKSLKGGLLKVASRESAKEVFGGRDPNGGVVEIFEGRVRLLLFRLLSLDCFLKAKRQTKQQCCERRSDSQTQA